eukprot:TRINITY_DN1238_c0_g1_i3.p1 TRINITY_DN1238_c0_g1~~TRINITY_DN1238_c0_g1_i3.p1  ORF type:complete len:230 (-),score=53.86 TRINITY_DN1238_c0_g1_i3:75-764(-)
MNTKYKDSHSEKMTRATLLASAERYINKDIILILDSINYIKGFRYEVYCRSRGQRTPNAVIFCATPKEEAKEFNVKREGDKWNDQLFDELTSRFEEPNPSNRWDRPLFTLSSSDSTPFQDILNSLYSNAENVPKNAATEFKKLEEPNFLFELDQITQSIISAVLEASNTGLTGDMVVPKSKLRVHLSRRVNLAELRRIRKQFIKMTGINPQPVDVLGDSFVAFLNNNLG